MSGPASIWNETAELYSQRLAAVSDEQWSAQTPCEEWDVRAVVDHANGVQALIAGALGATVAEGADWSAIQGALAGALEDPSVLDGTLPEGSPLGPMPKHQVLGIAIGDLLLHTWDVSRAIGADETLPPAAVQAVRMGLGNMPEEFMRAPGRFAPVVETDDSASAQDELIAFSGRTP